MGLLVWYTIIHKVVVNPPMSPCTNLISITEGSENASGMIATSNCVDFLKTLTWILNERQILIWLDYVDCFGILTTYMLIILELLIIWDSNSLYVNVMICLIMIISFELIFWKIVAARNQLLGNLLSKIFNQNKASSHWKSRW